MSELPRFDITQLLEQLRNPECFADEDAAADHIERLKAENQKLREGPQLRVNVEALVDDVERLTHELGALRQFVEKHSRTSGHKMDGTAQYRMTGVIGRGKTLWDAIESAQDDGGE